MNSITITGNLGKDAELRHLQDGTPVCSFSVADNQGKDKPSIWWNCALWGKRGEALQQYLTKGQPVTVVGNVSEREWTDKDGQKRKSMDVRVQDVALQGGRKDSAQAAPEQYQQHQATPAAPAKAPQQPAPADKSGFDTMDDDIPF